MTPRFVVGSHVNVRRGNPPGHIRTPYYIRGKSGTVERICGEFRNPEELAYGRTGEPKHLVESLNWQLYWFDRFLNGDASAKPPDAQ